VSHSPALPPQRMAPVRPPDPEPVAEWSPAELKILAEVSRRVVLPRGRGNPYDSEEDRLAARQASWRRYAVKRDAAKRAARKRGNA
jgi:hypothetical protein